MAYQVAMYGWVMRVIMSLTVVMVPWLLRQPGYRLYDNVIMIHAPGNPWLGAALYGLLPNPLLRVRLSMIVVAAASMGLVFWLARRWWGLVAGIAAAILYAVWGPVIMDHLMYAEVTQGLLSLGALAIWHRRDGAAWRPVLAGVFVGMVVLVKQYGLAVATVFVIWRVSGLDWRGIVRDVGLFLLGVALPVSLVVGTMATSDRLADFLYWTWTYNFQAYEEGAARGISLREMALVAAWLALVPLFVIWVVPRRDQWRREGILLLGLLPALLSPAFPRYGRFHLSAAMPVVALAGAGAIAFVVTSVRERVDWLRSVLNVYGLVVVVLLLVALALPTYYRVKLGPRVGEYEALVPIADWVREESGVPSGTRVWLLPDIDPTSNFYVIGGYLPPTYWVPTYSWLYAAPGVEDRMLQSLVADPPPLAVMVERWRTIVPEALVDYLEAHYTPVSEAQFPYGIGTVTLYERVS